MTCEDFFKWAWEKITIKNFLILSFFVLVGLLIWNLITMVKDLNNSLMFKYSDSEMITDYVKDIWTMRGQMGDLLSGHFSALAFLAVALSVFLQNEANKQIREDIKKQDERFFIDDMNKRLDRYYVILNDKLMNLVAEYQNVFLKTGVRNPYIKLLSPSITDEVIEILNFIYSEIETIKNEHKTAYTGFRRELTLRLISNNIVKKMSRESIYRNKCKAFSLLD